MGGRERLRLTAQVVASAAAGVAAGAAINADLIGEDTRRAVSAAVGPFTAEIEAHVSEKVLGTGAKDSMARSRVG